MTVIEITINKANVFDEVAKTTSYIGKKKDTYDNVFTTDEDGEMLERFWVEACSMATNRLKECVTIVDGQPRNHGVDLTNDYSVLLKVADLFNYDLLDSMRGSLFSFFVDTIVSKWCMLADKEEAEGYATLAVGMMDDVVSKLWHRTRPLRPSVPVVEEDNSPSSAGATSGASQNDFSGAPTGPLT